MAELALRRGRPDDFGTLVALFDEAVAWMVARGQPGQWGDRPFSERPEALERVRQFATSPGLWIAERDGAPAGVVIVGVHPPHVEPVAAPELYIELLMSARARGQRHRGAAGRARARDRGGARRRRPARRLLGGRPEPR